MFMQICATGDICTYRYAPQRTLHPMCIPARVHAHVGPHTYENTRAHTYTCTRADQQAQTRVPPSPAQPPTRSRTHACNCECTRASTRSSMHTRTPSHPQAQTCVPAPTQTRPGSLSPHVPDPSARTPTDNNVSAKSSPRASRTPCRAGGSLGTARSRCPCLGQQSPLQFLRREGSEGEGPEACGPQVQHAKQQAAPKYAFEAEEAGARF